MNNHVVIIASDDWEGLFVNGQLVDEGHTLNDGISRKKYLSSICKKYEIQLDDIKEGYVTEEYDELLCDCGCFDQNLDDIGYIINE